MSKYNFRHRNFEPGDPDDIAYAWLSYDIAKYYFELLRNLLVLGGLYYITTKTQSGLLGLFTVISFFVFLMQIWSFIASWNVIVFTHIWPNNRGVLLDVILNLVVALGLAVGSFAFVIYCVSLISMAQLR